MLIKRQAAAARRDATRTIQRGLAWVAGAVGGAGEAARGAEKLVVFNPASTAQTATLATEDGEVLAAQVPALGIRVIEPANAAQPDAREAVHVDGERMLRNAFLAVTVDHAGRIGELRRMDDTGDHPSSDLSDVFRVSRPTIYRTLARQRSAG